MSETSKHIQNTGGWFILLFFVFLVLAAHFYGRQISQSLTGSSLNGVPASGNYIISDRTALEDSLQSARLVEVTSYLLPNWLAADIGNACRRGASSSIILANPDYDNDIASENASTVQTLTAEGCHATLAPFPLHLKAVIVNGQTAWLSDTNFSAAGYILRDIDSHTVSHIRYTINDVGGEVGQFFALDKGDALNLERSVIEAGNKNAICVSTESFDNSPVAEDLYLHQGPAELVVAQNEASRSPSEMATLRQLQSHGIQIRLSNANEKIAAGKTWGWLGSANATAGILNQTDWGFAFSDPGLLAYARERCQSDFDGGQSI